MRVELMVMGVVGIVVVVIMEEVVKEVVPVIMKLGVMVTEPWYGPPELRFIVVFVVTVLFT
jgi:hypothetical protein